LNGVFARAGSAMTVGFSLKAVALIALPYRAEALLAK